MNGRDGTVAAIEYACPCGCGRLGCVSVYTGVVGAGWKWNGNREKPTLTPSLYQRVTCGWHGHLTDGVFRSV